MPHEEEVDRLFALPLDEFTAARNELARRLKNDGEPEAAAEVKALPKPSAAIWAINQAARSDEDAVGALLAAGDELRAAQAHALGTQGGGEALRAAQASERRAVQKLTQRARQALEENGGPASRAQLERVERTLSAAAVDPEARELLQAGRLTRELEPAGFEALAGLAPPADAGAQTARDELADRRRQKEEQLARKQALQQAARDAERRAREAEHEAERAEHAAAEARRVADKARAAADDATAELEDL